MFTLLCSEKSVKVACKVWATTPMMYGVALLLVKSYSCAVHFTRGCLADHNGTLAESRQIAQAWDAGRPPQCQTEVIVAPGTKAAFLRQQQQEQEQDHEQQHLNSKANLDSADQDSEVRNQTGASLQLSLDTADMSPHSPDVQIVRDQNTAAVPPQQSVPSHQPQADAAAQVIAAADSGDFCNPQGEDDADSYQGLPTSPPVVTSPYQKQSGYGASDDEMPSARSLQGSEGGPDQTDAADSKQEPIGQQQTASLVPEQAVMADVQLNNLQAEQDNPSSAAEGTPKELQKASDMATNGPIADTAAVHQPSLDNPCHQAEHPGPDEGSLANTDMEVDAEAAPDASSAGAVVEIQHTEGTLWSWQSAKLCDTITPVTQSVQLAYLTPSGTTCRDVNMQQLRSIPPAFSGTHSLQRGDVVEVNLGHDKFMCAIVVSKHKVVSGLKEAVAKHKVVRSLKQVMAQRKVFSGFNQGKDICVSNIAAATSGKPQRQQRDNGLRLQQAFAH